MLQSQLRDAKAALHKPEAASHSEHEGNQLLHEGDDSAKLPDASQKTTVSHTTHRQTMNWIPWFLGGIGLVTFVWFVYPKQITEVSPPRGKHSNPPAPQPGRHLNTKKDPFYMQ